MNKKKHRISAGYINYWDIIPLLILLIAISVFFYISIRLLVFKEVSANLKKTSGLIQMQCSVCKKQIEYSADALVQILQEDTLILKNDLAIDALIRYNPFVPEVSITQGRGNDYLFHSFDLDEKSDFFDSRRSMIDSSISKMKETHEDKNWIMAREDPYKFYILYTCKIDSSLYMQIWLDSNFIYEYLYQYHEQNETQILMFRTNGNFLYTTESESTDADVFVLADALGSKIKEDLAKTKNSDIYEGIINGIRIQSSFSRCVFYIEENKELNCYSAAYKNYADIYGVLFRYFRYFGLLIFIILVMGGYVVIHQERNKRKRRSEILSLINKDLSIDASMDSDRYEAIEKRAIEIMESRLAKYEENEKKNSLEKESLRKELMKAQKIQKNIMPIAQQIPDNEFFEIFAISESAYDIGGDLYDYFFIDEDHLFFTVGDVSGKGISAALFMIFTHTLLRSIGHTNFSSSEIVSKVNEKLIEDNVSDLFVTLFVGILELSTGQLSYCNAAHCRPFLVRADGHIEEMRQTHGIPIGLYSKKKYTESTLTMKLGDAIILYTDGLIEAKDENGMIYSEDVLRYNLMGSWFDSSETIVSKIKKSIESFRGNMKPQDDMTIMVLKYKKD